jgi:hypothetical protein
LSLRSNLGLKLANASGVTGEISQRPRRYTDLANAFGVTKEISQRLRRYDEETRQWMKKLSKMT